MARARVEVAREGGEVLVPRAALRRPAEATTFGFSAPIFAVLLSVLLLREKVGVWRWSAVLVGSWASW